MNRTKLFKALRIAFSATCLVVAVLLCVLWVRSYWYADTAYCQFLQTPTLAAMSIEGRLLLGVEQPGSAGSQFGMQSTFLQDVSLPARPLGFERTDLGFNFKSYPLGWIVEVPSYFAIVVVSAAAAAPWIRWSKRFSLRTLLIATTLIAVALGLVVWLSRTS